MKSVRYTEARGLYGCFQRRGGAAREEDRDNHELYRQREGEKPRHGMALHPGPDLLHTYLLCDHWHSTYATEGRPNPGLESSARRPDPAG